jgi:hypothetical protein
MEEKAKQIAIVVVLLLVGCLIIGIVMAILGLKSIGDSVSMDMGGYSGNLADCEAGSRGSVSMFGMSMNLTVAGKATYRSRAACHSTGTMMYQGEQYDIDLYRVESNDQCMVLSPVSAPTQEAEDCDGSWPGYVPADR